MKNKDPQAIDSQVLKLTGKAELPKPLEIGHNYLVSIKGSITAKTESDNNDGSSTFYYKFEPVAIEVIDEKGERIQAKDTRRKSQMLRSCIWKRWQESGEDIDDKEFYNNLMEKIIGRVIEGSEFKSEFNN